MTGTMEAQIVLAQEHQKRKDAAFEAEFADEMADWKAHLDECAEQNALRRGDG